MMTSEDERKILEIVRKIGPAVVAFSGGVDSAVTAEAYRRSEVSFLAVTFSTPMMTEDEIERARLVSGERQYPSRILTVDPLNDSRVRANPPERCYWCKRFLFSALFESAASEGFRTVVDGSHLTDLAEERPGTAALREMGVKTPLIEAELTKEKVRALARNWGLSVADTPSSPCLATRVPFGVHLDPERLQVLGKAEAVVRDLGFEVVRLRDHYPLVRVEVDPKDILRLVGEGIYFKLMPILKEAGYRWITIDPAGYRPGGGF